MSTLWHDLKYSARLLLKSPGFTFVAVLSLALGVGANTAIFSLVNTALLRPLPFSEPDQLMFLAEQSRAGDRGNLAYPNFKDWQERAKSFAGMAVYRGGSFSLTGGDYAVRLQGRTVSGNFFELLGVQPELGRAFTAEDDKLGAAKTALISHGLWLERFGGDTTVVGREIKLDSETVTVVGVLPQWLEFLRRDDIYVPIGPTLTEQSGYLERGNHFGLYGVARLKPGVAPAQARAEIEGLAAQLEREYPETNSGVGAQVMPLAERWVENLKPALLVLLAAVAFVLLIACVNVANLALARGAERQREIAVRVALGAARWRIVRQLLSESMLLALLGGGAGLLLGSWLLDGLLALAPADAIQLTHVSLDGRVLWFTLGVSLVTGLLFGLVPALNASHPDLNAALKEGGRSLADSSREGLRRALLVAEVGLALVLLVGAGLMLRTVRQLTRVDVGFDADHLLTARFNLPADTYKENPRRLAFYDECLTRVSALPGVSGAALTFSLPIDGSNWNSVFVAADLPVPARADIPSSAFTPVSGNYFSTMNIPVLRGRAFNSTDTADGQRVVVINETMARRLWPGQDAVGKRIKQGWPEAKTPWREVIGVVADVKLNGVERETPLQSYLPLTQEPARSLVLVARTKGDPRPLGASVEQAMHSIEKDLPVFAVRSMDEILNSAIAQQRLLMTLLAGFSVVALLLAAVGIYGVISWSVNRRTHEIGIRMALGAQTSDVLRLVIGQGMRLALAGVVVGLVSAFGVTRLMKGLLFGVSASDPATFVGIAVLLALVSFAACYLPARRATQVDPMIALRHE
ncbi:MAG: ABC transporter permease [Pyrinomonadaceae bacterium]